MMVVEELDKRNKGQFYKNYATTQFISSLHYIFSKSNNPEWRGDSGE